MLMFYVLCFWNLGLCGYVWCQVSNLGLLFTHVDGNCVFNCPTDNASMQFSDGLC